MDLPQPPTDQELKNIIDKLAQFVARNGPEFEHMTKQKQKYNPKFSFLFGGSYFHYYQYRVTTEQAILKQKERSLEQQAIVQQALNRQSIQTAPWQQHIHQLQDTSQEQIRQSEQNLAAQHQLLLQQQQVQVDEVIRKAQDEKLSKLASENELDLKELDGILQPIIDSCTKDSISTGKGWIFSHGTTYAKSEVIILYILKRVTEPGATFEAKLHLVYLINDVLHHCIRKNAEDLKKILETAVVPIFCSTSIGVEADKQQKLSKLHKLWETNKYFSQTILDQLQNPAASLAAYQAGLIAEYATLITPITAAIQTQYSILQKQHQDFVAHLSGQMQQMQVQVDEVIRKAQDEKLSKLASENELDLKELDGILQPIIDSCTKDSISTGKGWIFSHGTTYAKSEVIILYILKRVTEPGATFEAKLHLVYLINDVLHHCIRKNAEDLKKILETAVVPIFCSTSIGVEADKQQKLSKLHKLWETNKYFSQTILDQLQNPAASLAAYQAGLIAEYATLITPITAAIQTQYSILQKQHQDFVAHLSGQMQQMQIPVPYAFQSPAMMIPGQQAVAAAAAPYIQPAVIPYESQAMPQVPQAQEIIPQPSQLPEEAPKPINDVAPENTPVVPEAEKPDVKKESLPEPLPDEPLPTEERMPDYADVDNHRPDPINCFPESDEPPVGGHGIDYIPPDMHEPYGLPPDMPVRHSNGRGPMGSSHYPDDYSPPYGMPHPRYGPEPEYGLTPPHSSHYGRHMPYRDIPPIGPHDMPPDYLEPALPPCQPPYYDLPAGLMVPLIRLEDTDYNNPLEPDDVQLPPPALPTERLLAAVEQFYCPPTHERTRNNAYVISSEGWEQLGLYEFFKAKTQAKKQKGLPTDERDYSCSMDLPAMKGYSEQPKNPRRRYREVKSPEPESAPPPPPPPPVKNGGKGKRRSRSISRSRSRSPDVPFRRSSRSPSPQRVHFQRSRGRSRSRSPEDKRRTSPDSRERRGGSPDSRERRGGSPDSRERRGGSPDSRERRGGSPDRDRSQSPPPSFNMGSSNSHERDRRLDESNKGHQLLKKMGWSGAGLGATEQGIQDPVDAGDVRDRQDMYKGIGSNLNDPYENFRKSKGQAFINRMKARAEELGKM
ncbi:calcium homeostasis endoplasmic reticulum protein-like [Uloborus diversus]|uniref:calcium homeostasis endoplasmic reticulum protein-like n=1 Tax=Uloborus diversus TaxID=327109 RepID=UPI00240A659B|nr:calcium homeostasis endoplasmic reticulum protein-like [Uloborus diversus]